VFILEHNFLLKSFSAVHEAFSSAYAEKKISNKTKLHRQV
jgi:hypothetical protein